MSAQFDLTGYNFIAGDTITIEFTFRDADGVIYDFSGVTKAWWTVKKSYDDADVDALVGPLDSDTHPTQVTYGAGGPGAGKARIIMTATETTGLSDYAHRYYDFQVLAGTTISTLVYGNIPVFPQVTRATS